VILQAWPPHSIGTTLGYAKEGDVIQLSPGVYNSNQEIATVRAFIPLSEWSRLIDEPDEDEGEYQPRLSPDQTGRRLTEWNDPSFGRIETIPWPEDPAHRELREWLGPDLCGATYKDIAYWDALTEAWPVLHGVL
jgi:hypothetical protein